MEKIANKTIDVYLSKLKEDIHKKVLSIGLAEKNPHDSNSLMQYVFDYENLQKQNAHLKIQDYEQFLNFYIYLRVYL